MAEALERSQMRALEVIARELESKVSWKEVGDVA